MVNSSNIKKDFRQDINGLRAWAVVAVVLYHFGVPGFTGGFVGVDIFFVISGFLMTSIIVRGLNEGRFSLWQFYLARARRIIPALAVLAIILLLVGWFTLLSTDYSLLGKHVAASLSFVSNMVFWLEAGYFDTASKEKWLLHTWSLSVEWQFYLLLPLALLGAWKLWPGRARITVLVALGFAVSLALAILVSPGHPSAAFYLLPTRAWEMLAGGLVYLLAHRCPVGARAKFLERLGFGLIVASVLVFDEAANWPGLGALVPVAGAVLVLMAAQSGSPWTASRLAQWLGNASYSIYLWHWPVVVALVYLGQQESGAAILVGLALTLVLGHLSYSFVETTTRRSLSRQRLSLGVISLAVATVTAATPGVAIQLNDGFQNRLPHAVEAVAQEANNRNAKSKHCHVNVRARGETVFPVCGYGGNEPSAVVIGDSHAQAIASAVDKASPSNTYGAMELSYPGCPALFGVKSDYPCAEYNKWLLKKLDEVPAHIPLIIMNRTSFYPLGAEHLIDSVCTFGRKREVYLVSPIPEMGVNVPRAMARALMMGTQTRVSISLDTYRARHSAVLAAQDEASRRCGVKILDPLPYLCKDGQCNGAKNGRPLYFDDNHLSEYGNKLLVPMFAEVFAGGIKTAERGATDPEIKTAHSSQAAPVHN
jgi:peptidoglycan/LPS O-acetylase OafA/YrhL